MKDETEWNKFEEKERAMKKKHRPVEDEYTFYETVASGETDAVRKNCENGEFLNSAVMGRLSESDIRNIKYHFVVTAALVTRFCVDAGMESEEAFSLSDFYIMRMDKCQSVESVSALHTDMVMDFVTRMRLIKKPSLLSKPVLKCVNYIYENLTGRISIEDLSRESGLSVNYLSRLFKNEVGLAASDYIREKKIVYSKQLLRHSEYSIAEIADMLSFSSQSHFVQVFRKLTGTTPKKYRAKSHILNFF